jgi:predicted amidophosphoribosyltransferase
MRRALESGLQAIADFLVDEVCHHCGAHVDAYSRLSPPAHAASAALGEPAIALGLGPVHLRTRPLCRLCLHGLRPWLRPLRIGSPDSNDTLAVYPAFEAESRVLTVIHLIKFAHRRRLAPWLARAVGCGLPAAAIDGCTGSPVLVPVPMHAASRRERGFNQAELLTRSLGEQWETSAVADALVKVRRTAPQSRLDRARRSANLRGAMQLGAGAGRLAGRTVIIVDDLLTTGATAQACAAAIRAANPREIRVVCAGYRP